MYATAQHTSSFAVTAAELWFLAGVTVALIALFCYIAHKDLKAVRSAR